MSALFVGIKGNVIAVDRRSGATLWSTHLKGSQFVTVAVEDGAIYAGTYGRLYCLDPGTGSVRWTNELPGMGYGLICIAGGDSSALFGEYQRRHDASHSTGGA
jgi:outer membrane protein assembly factor BamB